MWHDRTVSTTLTAADPEVTPAGGEPGPGAVAGHHTSGRTLVLFGTLLAVALMLALPIRTWLAQKSSLEALRDDIDAAQQRVGGLQTEQQQWLDPLFIEAQARLRLNLAKPGESALIALDRSAQAEREVPDPPATTWYEKVWRSTDAAAGRRPAPVPEQQTDGG